MSTAGAGALVIESLGDAQAFRTRWAQLAIASANIFSTAEWTDVWWRHFGAGMALDLASVRSPAGEIVAVLPLVRERRGPIGIVRFAGHGAADELGPVCAPADRDAATVALAGAGGDVLIADRLRSDWPRAALHGSVIREADSPVISLAALGSWDDYLAARSSNFRGQVRRRARKLEGALELRYRLSDDPDRLDADFDTLVALHRARWGDASSALAGQREAFHREFAAVALERGWLRLWIAEAQGVPVAAWYGYRFAEIESYYQSGRDPDWDQHAVGAGILEHSIREAFADGMREYRMLRGDESYKRRYATSIETVLTVAIGHSAGGRAAVRAVELLAARPRGRRLVKKLAG